MSRVEAAADRLPWLPDEPRPQRMKRRSRPMLPWASAAVALVAVTGFWLGTRSIDKQPQPAPRAAPSATVRLPEPQVIQPSAPHLPAQPEVNPTPAPDVRPAPVREVRIVTPRPERPAVKSSAPAPEAAAEPAAPVSQAPVAVAPPKVLAAPKLWNPRIAGGAAGRLVQIGAFGSIHQAKLGWWHMVRAYPAVAHLPSVVRPSRNSKGRVFYRFQIGTTSQAHSEILCQRMESIDFSCAVVGLPWKAKVER